MLRNLWHFDIELLLIQEKSETITSLPCTFKRKKKLSRGCLTRDQLNFQGEFYMLQLFQLSFFPLHEPRPAPRRALRKEPDRFWGQVLSPGSTAGKAAPLGRRSVCGTAFEADLWSKPNIVNARAALGWSNLYHIWIQRHHQQHENKPWLVLLIQALMCLLAPSWPVIA